MSVPKGWHWYLGSNVDDRVRAELKRHWRAFVKEALRGFEEDFSLDELTQEPIWEALSEVIVGPKYRMFMRGYDKAWPIPGSKGYPCRFDFTPELGFNFDLEAELRDDIDSCDDPTFAKDLSNELRAMADRLEKKDLTTES